MYFTENQTKEMIIMCQTGLISNQIVRLGTRSYKQRMEAKSKGYSISQLARLNKDLDDLYELLYSQWDSVTENDYKVFGGQLQIMLGTLKELYHVCKNMSQGAIFEKETEKLAMNYSAIYEVHSDIVNFKIKAAQNMELKSLMQQASYITSRINQ